MKVNICKLFGHKWTPVYIKGEYNGKMVKFISCYCSRCGYGENEVYEINDTAINRVFGTYSKKFFDMD